MRKLTIIPVVLCLCLIISNYYDINKKYSSKDSNCIPKSELISEYTEDHIDQQINKNKKTPRNKPKYEKID